MSDKRKKAVRARKAATGERYTTARMNLLGDNGGGGGDAKPGRFERLVQATIDLAETASEAYSVRQRVPLDTHGPSAAENALAAHLAGIAPDDLRRIEILMYVGRDGGAVADVTADLKRDEHHVTADVVKAKLPVLARYLRDGLRRAREEKVDLDNGWAVALERVGPVAKVARKPALGPWTLDVTTGLPAGARARYVLGDAPNSGERKPLIVVPMGGRWSVIGTCQRKWDREAPKISDAHGRR